MRSHRRRGERLWAAEDLGGRQVPGKDTTGRSECGSSRPRQPPDDPLSADRCAGQTTPANHIKGVSLSLGYHADDRVAVRVTVGAAHRTLAVKHSKRLRIRSRPRTAWSSACSAGSPPKGHARHGERESLLLVIDDGWVRTAVSAPSRSSGASTRRSLCGTSQGRWGPRGGDARRPPPAAAGAHLRAGGYACQLTARCTFAVPPAPSTVCLPARRATHCRSRSAGSAPPSRRTAAPG